MLMGGRMCGEEGTSTAQPSCACRLASFKRVQQRLCCDAMGESRAIAALKGGN